MTTNAEGIKKARTSQRIGEQHVLNRNVSRHTLIDDPVTKTDVKTTQEFTTAGEKETHRRHGRFRLELEQHEYLLKINGDYVFVVHSKGEIIGEKRFKARKLEEEFNLMAKLKAAKSSAAITITWTSLLTAKYVKGD